MSLNPFAIFEQEVSYDPLADLRELVYFAEGRDVQAEVSPNAEIFSFTGPADFIVSNLLLALLTEGKYQKIRAGEGGVHMLDRTGKAFYYDNDGLHEIADAAN